MKLSPSLFDAPAANRTGASSRSPEAGGITFSCTCGQRWRVSYQHYAIMRCDCGKFWWALRPKAQLTDQGWVGPLKMFPWPGDKYRNPDGTARQYQVEQPD